MKVLEGLRYWLQKLNLYAFGLSILYAFKYFTKPAFRQREKKAAGDFSTFNRNYGEMFGCILNKAGQEAPKALLVSMGSVSSATIELTVAKGLELAGFQPVLLTQRNPWIEKYYRLGNISILFWDRFAEAPDSAFVESVMNSLKSFEDLLKVEWEGIRVGKFVASTLLRDLKVGFLDLKLPAIRQAVERALSESIRYAKSVKRILKETNVSLVLLGERGYTPWGQFYDACLAGRVECISWNVGHKSSTLVFKRYGKKNRAEHHVSLSEETWEKLKNAKWDNVHEKSIKRELEESYLSGDWYSEVGTQFHKRMTPAGELKKTLRLDPNKKTAIIFPHILWDSTFFWGVDLFRNYEEWLIETLKAACQNKQVNWIVKLHPANVIKNRRSGLSAKSAEYTVIQEQIGELPEHIKLIAEESDINTYALFSIMDYCVTVRGTIGIEAAVFGIPVLTAGTGRYDHKGFTVDSDTREDYLRKIAQIQDIPEITQEQTILAQKYAYGIFILRTMKLQIANFQFRKDELASFEFFLRAKKAEDWLQAPDVRAFADWVGNKTQEDFLCAAL